MSNPQFDIIVFGATSFVGQILSRYLIEQYGLDGNVKWAIAGRSEGKLVSLKADLGAPAADLDIIIADASDDAQLAAMCAQTRTVISTVGPYALYGEPLVKACCEQGTHYCDLTGEVQWIREMIIKYEAQAKASGARIVHCCGFDSIPSDLGVFFLQQQAAQQFGAACPTVKMRVKAAKGGFSGGTAASLINVAKEAAADPALRKSLANPYSICPTDFRPSRRQHNVKSAEFDADFDAWTAPFVMGAINTRVVHRSNALQHAAYGEEFGYDEAVLTGTGLKGRAAALAVTAGMGGFLVASVIKPTRWALEKFVLPKPGEGPTPKAQREGFYDLRFVGISADGKLLRTKVTGDRDPGYGSTGKMLGEAAMCLTFDLDAATPGGFWTPASLFGHKIIERLEANAGLRFEVMESR
ncbi:MAG: saccharopine dehydrogenase [Alteromonadaceae bacterium]|uniref:saccharopine dehydrogenase family protein n=1 Tax=Marinobacter sp. V034 TaxID=3459610 RepID=UPI000C55DFDD|nr:saccharopine dehydrogenase [Alteromonadaceae bacterium]MBH84071.1 saccharopine dehydrogenase [Alteromonadaceae bacterium]|tara:strand:+ start:5775 stop:7010 length:1236 start_codon:yes stop_codon:yes gene_type:complete